MGVILQFSAYPGGKGAVTHLSLPRCLSQAWSVLDMQGLEGKHADGHLVMRRQLQGEQWHPEGMVPCWHLPGQPAVKVWLRWGANHGSQVTVAKRRTLQRIPCGVCTLAPCRAANCNGVQDGCTCGSPVSLVERRKLQPHLTILSTSHTARAVWFQWLPNIMPILLLHEVG